MVNEQEFILPVTEEEYETAGSKFMTYPPVDAQGRSSLRDRLGESLFLKLEIGMVDWDTPGKSLKFPVVVIEEGPDKGKEDKISVGVDAKGIWKLKEVNKNVTGKDLEMRKGADGKNHPVFNPSAYAGKQCIGHYQIVSGRKGGDPNGEMTYYPKLQELLPLDAKVGEASLM